MSLQDELKHEYLYIVFHKQGQWYITLKHGYMIWKFTISSITSSMIKILIHVSISKSINMKYFDNLGSL